MGNNLKLDTEPTMCKHIGWAITGTMYGQTWGGYDSSLGVPAIRWYGDTLSRADIFDFMAKDSGDLVSVDSVDAYVSKIYQLPDMSEIIGVVWDLFIINDGEEL